LLSNASKFTDQGTITLTVTRQPREGEDWITFTVRDTGIGMTAEQVQNLFQPFTQADSSTTRKYGGTGLGLTINRQLCQMMGGDVEGYGTPGQGSTFPLRLPAEVRKPEAEAPAAAAPSAPASLPVLPRPGEKTVLVVDDDPAVRDLLSRSLTKEGFQVVTSARG